MAHVHESVRMINPCDSQKMRESGQVCKRKLWNGKMHHVWIGIGVRVWVTFAPEYIAESPMRKQAEVDKPVTSHTLSEGWQKGVPVAEQFGCLNSAAHASGSYSTLCALPCCSGSQVLLTKKHQWADSSSSSAFRRCRNYHHTLSCTLTRQPPAERQAKIVCGVISVAGNPLVNPRCEIDKSC